MLCYEEMKIEQTKTIGNSINFTKFYNLVTKVGAINPNDDLSKRTNLNANFKLNWA